MNKVIKWLIIIYNINKIFIKLDKKKGLKFEIFTNLRVFFNFGKII